MKLVPTGSTLLDNFLGGFEPDAITTIYGPAGSGKTNIAVLAAASVAERGKKVIYLDTEGGFSVTRLKQIVKDPKKVLSKIMFLSPTNFEEQVQSFKKLQALMRSKSSDKIGMVIVDTIGMLYRLERKFGEGTFHQELGLQITTLNEICRKKHIPVLICNQVYKGFDMQKGDMVGGDIVRYASKCLIELEALHGGKRRIILRKHRSMPEKDGLFKITGSGLEEL
ncbi:MAG: DNA repair and recombination protein RadB [Candidatus Woesearchaeota archaeon]|jgi:DNA repair protein RadB|nr:DNA repair and recombination protein RadB [Candidatus Woesearchaeota archaeon]MDP7199146.1 DNA repair and recombination protein RadB [Candidatus Woesearchaeota archaeon]MDP7467591.1 DNA repair and recombination protein RadB [Candidatus Woesearchaeota archaeon]MDP7647073.1 DNA repair and recombination protein RadB [Candidatus Woesearchaeota archaeon]|tara:strand:- start:331 stop:1002 length:672 start_codon:yes stop_codon:yes gene_type:complete